MKSFEHSTYELWFAVEELHRARTLEAEYKAKLDAIKADIEAEIERRFGAVKRLAEESLAVAKADVADCDALVRKLAVERFEATGEKHYPGVDIAEYTTVYYDDTEALEWARETGLALKLDKSKFKKYAPDLPFVEVRKEPRARVASDLSKALNLQEGE